MTVQTERRAKRKAKLKWYIAGPLICAVSLPALLYLCAILLAREVLPFEVMAELVIACVFVSAALGGMAACSAREGKVMQTGLATGAIFAGILVVITLVVPGEGALNADCLRHVIAAVCGGAFGGALCIKRGGHKPKRRKHR